MIVHACSMLSVVMTKPTAAFRRREAGTTWRTDESVSNELSNSGNILLQEFMVLEVSPTYPPLVW